ncbi:MAG: endonuclease/exonuclease/phosphatase family protein [Oscillospiraceae bacterium]
MSLTMTLGFTGCKAKVEPACYPNWAFESLKKENAEMSKEANIRIMSSNVLVHIKGWGGIPVKPRAQQFAEVLHHYTPDVVALQEMCKDWYKLLPPQISDTYAMLDTKPADYTTMIYNTKTLKLLEQGIFRYTKESNKNCRFIVWGVFEKLETGEKFAVTSTHWDFGMQESKIEMRTVQVKEQSELVAKLANDYGVPVFTAGDFNSFEKEKKECADSYNEFLEISGMVDSKFVDGVEKKFGPKTTYETETWDHIFITGKVKPITFNILANDFYEDMSDHPMIYLDAKI